LNPISTTGPRRVSEIATHPGNRYWWHRRPNCGYEPPVYGWLGERDWATLREWFTRSEEEFGGGTGECSVPCISMLQGLIMGNGISRIVQLGHDLGYSTLLISMMLERMDNGGQLYSVDINQRATDFTQQWVDRSGNASLVTLDSSHMYRHTLAELDLWYPALQDWGFIVLHDASTFAAAFDGRDEGGVKRAIEEWNVVADDRIFTITSNFGDQPPKPAAGEELVYVDGCGLGLLQKLPR
jgi:hypothetical protein